MREGVKTRSNTGGASAIITHDYISRFALYIFGVPAMSSEPERVFSVAGQLIRARLHLDVIGAALCLKSWDCYQVAMRK